MDQANILNVLCFLKKMRITFVSLVPKEYKMATILRVKPKFGENEDDFNKGDIFLKESFTFG